MQRLLANRFASTITYHASTASRELALPIVFLTSRRWSRCDSSIWKPWIDKANGYGYACQAIDLDPDLSTLDELETELASQIRQSQSPFPPLLFSSSLDTLISEKYVSSHPLSGLVLVDPPLNIGQVAGVRPDLPLPKEEHDYEPFFPVAILTPRARAAELEEHRLRQDYSEDVNLLVSPQESAISEDGFDRVKDWMDSNGL